MTYNYRILQQTVETIAQGKLIDSVAMLYQLLKSESNPLPQEWLLNTAKALETGEWGLLSEDFCRQKFVGQDGYFLIIAPYTIRRGGTISTKLTAIFGRIIPVTFPPIEKLEDIIRERIGELHQPIPLIIPYERIAACGNANSEQGEAFIVPNNWDFPNSFNGPALNDMTEQKRRFLISGRQCLHHIWEPDSAELLLAALANETTATHNRHLEYQFHDAGHATGLGIDRKIKEDLFPTYWYACVEEWRSDGVEFELAQTALSTEKAGQIVAVNLCVRLALDAHRRGGIDGDGDACASLLTFDRLLESGEIGIKNSRLYLRDLSYQGLLRAVEPHRQEAVRLTQQELKLDDCKGLFRLYGSLKYYNQLAEQLFQLLVVEKCLGVYPALR
jgi:Family of unknown function (DUF6014)